MDFFNTHACYQQSSPGRFAEPADLPTNEESRAALVDLLRCYVEEERLKAECSALAELL